MSDLQCPTTILVARHGDAEYESDVWVAEGGSLTHRGRTQAARLGDDLTSRRIAHVWSSPMARAVQTAEIAAAHISAGGSPVGVTIRQGLREFDIGDFTGSTEADPFAPTYSRWLQGDLDARIPGAESGTELVERMRLVLSEIVDQHRGETVLAISHGGLMRLTLPQLLIAEPAQPPDRLGNTATVELVADNDGWLCTRWPPPAPPGD